MVPLPVVPNGPPALAVGPGPARDDGDRHHRRVARRRPRPYELPVVPRLGVRQIAAILGRTIRSTYALTQDFDDAGLRLPGRDLFVRTVPFFEWLHSHPRLRSRAETLADRDQRREASGGFLRPGPKGRTPQVVALG